MSKREFCLNNIDLTKKSDLKIIVDGKIIELQNASYHGEKRYDYFHGTYMGEEIIISPDSISAIFIKR